MKALKFIQKNREYLDYLEEHILNIQKAFFLVEKKCRDMNFVWDDFKWEVLKMSVENHDLSKFSTEEFVQYRQKFYPTKIELSEESIESKVYPQALINDGIKHNFQKARQHHIKNNHHHWENWSTGNSDLLDYDGFQKIECVHMAIDWIAMGLKFNNSAKDYYLKNKEKIEIPEWADSLLNEIFDRVYPIAAEDLILEKHEL